MNAILWAVLLASLQEPPKEESLLDRLKKEIGVDDLQIHGYVRPRMNYYDNAITLGRDTTAPAFRGADDANNYFFDLRAWLSLQVVARPWSMGLRLDLGGNDFNDGGILGNDSDVANSNLGLGPAGLRDFDVDLGQAWVAYEEGAWKAEFGRLPFAFAHGILTKIQRDSLRVSWKEDSFTLTGAWIAGAQGAGAVDADEALTGDDSAVKYTSGAIGEFNTFGLSAQYVLSPEYRLLGFVGKQVDGTRDNRFTEKLFLDLAGFYSAAALELSYEGIYMDGKGADRAADGRPDVQGYLVFLSGRARLSESGVKAGLAAGVGSGDNTPLNDESNGIENLFVDETSFAYSGFYADDLHGYNGSALSLRRASGFANTLFVQPNLRVPLSETTTLSAAWTWLRAVREQPEGTGPMGGFLAGRGNYGLDPAMRVDPVGTDESRDIGHEIDLSAEHRASKRVRVLANLAAFLPGDLFGDDAHTAWKFELGTEFQF